MHHRLLRRIVDVAVPSAVALAAFLHAHAIGALIGASMSADTIAPFAEARAAGPPPSSPHVIDAGALLDRNPFDHVTGSLRPKVEEAADAGFSDETDLASAPPCNGIKVSVAIAAVDADDSIVALDFRGKKVLRRTSADRDGHEDLDVVHVGLDRAWVFQGGHVCVAYVFAGDAPAGVPAAPTPMGTAPPSALEKEIAGKIVKSGPTEWQVDRGALDRLLEAQAELMKTPLVPEKEGDRLAGYRIVRVKPGSAIAMLGLESGDRLESINGLDVTNVERLMEAYARIKSGTADRMTLHVTRGGKPVNLDYVIR